MISRDASHEQTRQLLDLGLRVRANQRRIYVGLAIAVACTTAILLDAFWHRGLLGRGPSAQDR